MSKCPDETLSRSPLHLPARLGRNEIQLPITEYNTEVERALLLPKECAECPLGFDRQLADFGLAAPNECREALRWPDTDDGAKHPWNFH